MRILYLPNSYSQQRQYEKKANIYPVLMAMEAEFYRKQGHEVYWNLAPDGQYKIIKEPEGLPFLSLPHPDRVFTRAKEYTSGNYKYLPGTHMQVANGCWWGKCSFCVEKEKPYEVRSVDDVIDEIKECQEMGFREIFDDSGTFPIGDWFTKFSVKMICRNIKITLGCNMRMVDVDYKTMKRIGFRMLLFGLESANQETLDRINKGRKVEDVRYIIKAAECGLSPHIAVMFGYPWETDEDAIRTLKLVWYLLRKGYAKTAQASLYSPDGNPAHRKYVKRIYQVAYSPQFWFRKLRDIKDIDDLKYLWKQIKTGLTG